MTIPEILRDDTRTSNLSTELQEVKTNKSSFIRRFLFAEKYFLKFTANNIDKTEFMAILAHLRLATNQTTAHVTVDNRVLAQLPPTPLHD